MASAIIGIVLSGLALVFYIQAMRENRALRAELAAYKAKEANNE